MKLTLSIMLIAGSLFIYTSVLIYQIILNDVPFHLEPTIKGLQEAKRKCLKQGNVFSIRIVSNGYMVRCVNYKEN